MSFNPINALLVTLILSVIVLIFIYAYIEFM